MVYCRERIACKDPRGALPGCSPQGDGGHMEQKNHFIHKKGVIFLLRLLLPCLLVAVAAAVFIFFYRAQLNAAHRQSAIDQRLRDYNPILQNFFEDTEKLYISLEAENNKLLCSQAALLFSKDASHDQEEERLEWIRSLLENDTVRILAPEEEVDLLRDSTAPLPDGRTIAITFPSPAEREYGKLEALDYTLLMNRLKSGAPGYYLVSDEGEWKIWPEDGQAENLRALVSGMLSAGQVDYTELRKEAGLSPDGVAITRLASPASDAFPAGRFTVSCAAYKGDTSLVVNLTETAEMYRVGSERTWCLIILVAAVFIFLGWSIGRTDLYQSDYPYSSGRRKAFLKCRFLLLTACVTLFVSVLDVQLLSVINQNAESTVSSVTALQEILAREEALSTRIRKDFDRVYQQRANTAARFFSANPGSINMDTLASMDDALGGLQLEIRGLDNRVTASDASIHAGDVSTDEPDTAVYRSPLLDAKGQTTGYVDFHADVSQYSALLKDSTVTGVISSMHMLDNLEVLAVDSAQKQQVQASSREDWVGLSPEQLGLDTDLLYNRFEGVLKLGGQERYASVFSRGEHLIIVSCKNTSFLDYLGRTALLVGVLAFLALLLFTYTVRRQYALQAATAGRQPDREERYPPLRFFLSGFMLTLFFLTVCLYVTSELDPGGMTYKLVRGQWVLGINPVTFTFVMMISSLFLAVCILLDLVMERVYKFSSPRSITICELVKSASRYVAVIALILTTLSMFGVNTGTLLGGAGVVALVFTLGANSLLSDVIAGIFLIFDKSFSIGDYVTVGSFNGYIRDISIRCTTIQEPETRNIKIVNNATLKDLINRSKTLSSVFVDFIICHDIGLKKGEKIIEENLEPLPAKYPQIVGKPRYLGVVTMPQQGQGGFRVRVAFDCQEKDRIQLEYRLQRELLWLANLLLNDSSEAGIDGCRVD